MEDRQTVPPLAPSTLSLDDALQIFDLRWIEDDVFWAEINELPIPQYLIDSIERILAITSNTYRANEAFSRTIIDQIPISAIYEENHTQTTQTTQHQTSSSQPEDPIILELQHETQLQRQVTYQWETRLLSGYADYTVWNNSSRSQKPNLATNLIIIEAKKPNYTDTCLGQLAAYMGIVHARRKDEEKEGKSIIYGIASDGLAFRFCRIDNEGNRSQSCLLEWKMGDQAKIYSVFRFLIRTAAALSSSSPSSTSAIIEGNPRQRHILASFGGSERTRCNSKFDYDLSTLELLEEDDDTEIISLPEC